MFIKALEDEAEILGRLTDGDELAFTQIYHHYYSSVQSAVIHLLLSPQLAEDVTQEIFLKLWEQRNKLPHIHSFRSYLFIATRNHSLNVLKRAARSKAGLAEIIRHAETVRNTTEETILGNEYLAFIQRCLADLPPRSREIFRMCREQSQTYDEVAAALGVTRDAVKSRMMHAMKVLRASAEKELGLPLAILLISLPVTS